MTDDQIRRLAMESGFFADDYFGPLKQFANLVMEADRAEAVEVLRERFSSMLFRTAVASLMDKIREVMVQVIEGERDV